MKSFYKNRIFIVTILLFMIVGSVVLNRNQVAKPMQNQANRITVPVASLFSGIGFWFNDKFSFIDSISQLKNDNESLVNENLSLKAQIAQLKDIRNENDVLRDEIKLAKREQYNLESALIIGKDLKSQSDIIYINKGIMDGVQENMAVVVGNSVLIGKVIQAYERESIVEMVFSRESRINAEIEESKEKGIIKGEFGTSAILDGIAQTVEVKPGDTVISSGLGNTFPRGLLIGYIKDSAPTADQLFQRASVILPFEPNKLRMVWVIKD